MESLCWALPEPGTGTGWALRALQTQTIPWFCDNSGILCPGFSYSVGPVAGREDKVEKYLRIWVFLLGSWVYFCLYFIFTVTAAQFRTNFHEWFLLFNRIKINMGSCRSILKQIKPWLLFQFLPNDSLEIIQKSVESIGLHSQSQSSLMALIWIFMCVEVDQ